MPETSSDRIGPTFVDIILPLEQSENKEPTTKTPSQVKPQVSP
ncbi:MAG: hypothetical protein VX372_03760 [Verrucomicrobiota bacterium]|nr:hypothetical protein [Verrucomicrobiota bacterium]